MQKWVNVKLAIHSISVLILSFILIYFIDINTNWLIVIISSLLITLVINQTTFLSLKNEQLVVIKKVLIFIPVFKRRIKLPEINELSFYKNVMNDVDFEGAIISKIIIGSYFYESNYGFFVKYNNKAYESDIHLSESKIESLKSELKNKLGDNIIS
ncbi:MAG: hypothetical protein GQ564_23950 [Bacteroidales bacterium]|nr:hypothetical protein [Bacteroidales bacterium]